MKNSYKIVLPLFVLALVMRSIVFFADYHHTNYQLIPAIIGDDGYYQIATNLVIGNGFSDLPPPEYRPNALRPPLYSFFIAGILLLFHSHWFVLIAQILLGSFIPILGYLFASRFVSKKIALWVGVALSLDPFLSLLSVIYYTETLFTVLFLGHLILFTDYLRNGGTRRLIWSGVLFAAALLVKPTIEFLPPLIATLIWYVHRSQSSISKNIFPILVYPLLCLVFVAPWLYRNAVEFGALSLGAQPAYNLQVYLVPTVLAIDNHTSFALELTKLKANGLDEFAITPTTSSYYKHTAITVLREHPRALVISGIDTIITFFTHDGMVTALQHVGISTTSALQKPALSLLVSDPVALLSLMSSVIASPLVLVIIFRCLWILVTIGFLYGSWFYIRKKDTSPATLYAIGIVFYFAATTAINGLGVNARFRVPVDAVILTFAFYGLSLLWSAILRVLHSRAHV